MARNAPAPTRRKLVSQLLSEDPDLRDVVEEFITGLPAQVSEMRSAHERLDWDNLRMLAHRLKGSGGSYGYPELSGLAAVMEEAFKRQCGEQFAQWTSDLERLIEAARAGLEPG